MHHINNEHLQLNLVDSRQPHFTRDLFLMYRPPRVPSFTWLFIFIDTTQKVGHIKLTKQFPRSPLLQIGISLDKLHNKLKQSPDLFCKKCVFNNFTKFTEKHLRQTSFLIKLQTCKVKACNFIKKETLAQSFPVNFAKFLRTPFFIEHLRWLLRTKNRNFCRKACLVYLTVLLHVAHLKQNLW